MSDLLMPPSPVDASWFAEWRTGEVWVTSDLHLGHERIIELCARPFASVEEMNEAILDGINSSVRKRDTLVVLGDIVMGRLEENLKLLRRIRAARVWLLPGNHDRWSLAYAHRGSVEVLRGRRSLWRAQYEAQWETQQGRRRTNVAVRQTRVEVDVQPSSWLVPLAGRQVMMSHYPYTGESSDGRADRYQALRPVDRGLPLVHGHVHGAWQQNGRMFNVGVDVRGFKPVPEAAVSAWLEVLEERVGVV